MISSYKNYLYILISNKNYLIMVYECCICFEAYDEKLDNNDATSCGTCKNKICLNCYDKSTELRMSNDKFDKLVNNCCICRSETEKTDLNDFNKEQLQYLLITAFERIHSTDLKMVDYKKRYEELEDANLKSSLDLIWIVGSAKSIIENKKNTKQDIKKELAVVVKNIGISVM